jgi:alpha-galactosidase
MLEVGNSASFTINEQKSHFALWCFAKSPLILGNDLSNMSAEVLAIISNPRLIAVNQDPNGMQAKCV